MTYPRHYYHNCKNNWNFIKSIFPTFICNAFLSIILISFVQEALGQRCPSKWESFGLSCYKFSKSPRKTLAQAEEFCATYNAKLVAVNSLEEHHFISSWLRKNDPQKRLWHTSARDTGNNIWKWDADRTDLSNIHALWLPQDRRFDFLKHAAYNWSQTENRWGLVRINPNDELAYICEVKKEDLTHVIVVERTIDYGVNVIDKTRVPRGPKFTQEPVDYVFDVSGRSQVNYATLRCVADGFPTPRYKWYKEEFDKNRMISRYIDPLEDSRLTQTDGTLIIHNPQQSTDRGKYHCTAENDYGKIRSRTVQLTFGYIGEFTKRRSPDYGKEYWGKSISCDPPQHHPRVNYYWTRNQFPNFVEEDRRVFVSHDGNLYFSSLEKIDRANYSCNVQSVISSTGRTGPFFPLIIDPASSGQKLLFPNNFPKAFPEAPLAGEDIRLECVAYGYPVPSYNWTRTGVTNRLPEESFTTNHNRVLIIPKAQVEDAGEYICTATSGREIIHKSIVVSIQAKPIFTIPLEDQVLRRAGEMIWTCEAFGIPDVTYTWFKNGEELTYSTLPPDDIHRYKIKENVLQIEGLTEARDEGMYQCKAENQLGEAFTAGQLRITTMKPTFAKHKLEAEMYAAVGGNITIPCIPEAIPFPRFTWKYNGLPIGAIAGRTQIMPNGFLQINPVQEADQGFYTCVATNEYGTDQTEGYLTVFKAPIFVETPRPKVIAVVNETIELPCYAHVNDLLDIAYIWLHNGLRLNFTKMPQFSHGAELGYLKISNITLAEAGEYTCIVKTALGKRAESSLVLVEGPPSAPGAVLAEDITSSSATLHWSDGSDNGRRVWAYTVEGRTNHNSTWLVIAGNITFYRTQPLTGRKEARLEGLLSPWSSYEFRVSAQNDLGQSPPSQPSPQYSTDKDKPFKAPQNVGGGGGKAGTLTITWDPLPPQDWNAPEIWYKIYYKPLESDIEYQAKELRTLGNIGMYAVHVGEENYYKKFRVLVQALNTLGPGPVSEVAEVYSAESMPSVQPSQLYATAYNSTSLNVTWAPLDLAREKIRGKLVGYRIKYWRYGKDPQVDALTVLKRGLKTWGLVVGLQPNTDYNVAVMAYNDAGSGPESEPITVRTFKSAPRRPPSSVSVKALDSTSVLVTWRGVTAITTEEEPISGYKVRYWEADQSIAHATDVYKYLDGGELETVISGLVPGKVYKLRVLAFSLGGDGKMSSPAWEFKVGEGVPQSYSMGVTSAALSYQHLTHHLSLIIAIITLAARHNINTDIFT